MIAYNLNEAAGKPKEVKKLYLRNIGLTEIPAAIREMQNLKFLGLSKNRISNLPDWLKDLNQLEGLDLSDNQFENIPEAVFKLPKIKIINFGKNQLKEISNEISNCKYLESFTVSKNQISKIPKALFSKSLKLLDLSNNQVAKIPESFQQAIKLERIYFSNNKISYLPSIDYSKLSLSHIYLEKNNLKSLPEDIGQLNHLRDLKIRGNKIKNIPNSIGNCKYLWEFDLSQNKVETVPDSIVNCQWLHVLNLQKNKLKTLPEEIGNLKKLRVLNLEYNDLKHLPDSLFSLIKIEKLLLRGNIIQASKVNLIRLANLKKLTGLTNLFSASEKSKFLTFMKYCKREKVEGSQREQFFKMINNNQKVSKKNLIVASNFPIPKVRHTALEYLFDFHSLKTPLTKESILHFTGRTYRIKKKFFEELKQLEIRYKTKFTKDVTHIVLGDFPDKQTLEQANSITFISEQELLNFIQSDLKAVVFSSEEFENLSRLLLSEHKETLLLGIQILENTIIPSAFITNLFIAYKVCTFPAIKKTLRDFLMLYTSTALQKKLKSNKRLPKQIVSEKDELRFLTYAEQTELNVNQIVAFFRKRNKM